ncbi:fumarylacetoacetate hydrolase family protein [Halobacillus naozhouensis]|uniref:Fumarylacetoacetate hydrolase family protein n=1 Tax=Halobacillus naozhouensis TaxID=554880 RepID=A0ABY8IY20_9BACI|nr:fumarylacetoacetate hydrolase family protein [Halobacillus naozhouensis]WFT74108.1 fumarylacetoacetate hydrolase family protein [Halobacillus naozhouensis]
MRTVMYQTHHGLKMGVKTDRGILDVDAAAKTFAGYSEVPITATELLYSGGKGRELLQELVLQALQEGESSLFHKEETLEFGPCVDNPQKIICIGLNYRNHAAESNMPIPEVPIVFSKFSNALTGDGADIKLPVKSQQVDYEAELAIVIGAEVSRVKEEEALSYVYGYCNANDLSARDLQMKTPQWLLGKTCDGFAPVGPYLVSKDEIPDPNQLSISTVVNGEVRQSSQTSDMIFSCEEIIAYLSDHMTLYPGDMIMTGTPEGVIMGYPEEKQSWLKAGDEVTIEIENIGSLTNQFIDGQE